VIRHNRLQEVTRAHEVVAAKLQEIEELCRMLGVRRLDVFGSAASSTLDVTSSDVDVLVEFDVTPGFDHFGSYSALKEGLEEIFDRPVDLVSSSSIRNPYSGSRSWTPGKRSTRRDPHTYLWDAVRAAELITGEALNNLSKVDAGLAASVPELGLPGRSPVCGEGGAVTCVASGWSAAGDRRLARLGCSGASGHQHQRRRARPAAR
jgi:predicted nucleotidyltransferase